MKKVKIPIQQEWTSNPSVQKNKPLQSDRSKNYYAKIVDPQLESESIESLSEEYPLIIFKVDNMKDFSAEIKATKKIKEVLMDEGIIKKDHKMENLHLEANGRALNHNKNFIQNQVKDTDVIYVHLSLKGGSKKKNNTINRNEKDNQE